MIPKPKKPPRNQGRTKWLKFRKDYLKRLIPAHYLDLAGYECSLCHRLTAEPELDHIKPRSTNPTLVYEATNIQLLCPACHRQKHQKSLDIT